MFHLRPETYQTSTSQLAGRYFGRDFHNREIQHSIVGIVYWKKRTEILWVHHFKVSLFKVPLWKNCFFLPLRRIDSWNIRCWLTLAFPEWKLFLQRRKNLIFWKSSEENLLQRRQVSKLKCVRKILHSNIKKYRAC